MTAKPFARNPLQRRATVKWPASRVALAPDEVSLVRGWYCAEHGGAWAIEQMFKDMRAQLVHARGWVAAHSTNPTEWHTLAFALKKNVLVTLGQSLPKFTLIQVWALSPESAEAELLSLRRAYFRERQRQTDPNLADFYVLTLARGEPYARRVTTSSQVHTVDALQLHYGEQFLDWHLDFVRQLKAKSNGLTILQGPPGVGKTSYLRGLMAELRFSHRFYYLPVSSFSLLSAAACTDFWLGENERHKQMGKVCVIEDADNLLAKRGQDNQESLSNLLNIADGFLADTLRVHAICTVNAAIDALDPAVVRPGRLVAAREFRRLTLAEAEKIAQRRRLDLLPQESYSLAEIYSNCKSAAGAIAAKKAMGFTAAASEPVS